MVARRSIVAALASLCASLALVSMGAPAALAVEPPVIEGESVLDVASTSATLQATINPEGSETTYRFEYGPTEAYGSSIPVPDGLVGSGASGVTVGVHLQGLASGTAYHYRVVAAVPSRSETVSSDDATFTTQRAGGELSLLDGREWELVSPPNKHGANVLPDTDWFTQAAEGGHAFAWMATAPVELKGEGYANDVRVMSRRGPEGWSSKDIATAHSAPSTLSVGFGNEYRMFSSDLSLGLVEPQGPFTPLSADATGRTPYIERPCESASGLCYTPLVTAANVPPGTDFNGEERLLGEAQFVDGTPDFSHVLLRSLVGLTSTPGDEGGLYEWTAGRLQLVSVLPESEGGTPAEKYVSVGDRNLGTDARNAFSRDGSRVFWTSTGGLKEGDLYLTDTVEHETLLLGKRRFQFASSDGSRAFFVNQEVSNPVLEECEVVEVEGKLACEATSLATGLVGDLSAASEDGSTIYFVSNAVLAPGAVVGECDAFEQVRGTQCNLYAMRRGAGGWGAPKLIAVLPGQDVTDWSTPRWLTARASGNGRWFAFMSDGPLTGYDTRDVVTGQADNEVYLYDDNADKLVCASCDPTGARPTGRKYIEPSEETEEYLVGGGIDVRGPMAANVPPWGVYRLGVSLYQPRYLSDDGRLFFNSGDALAPQDVNGKWDVYEYEPAGTGSCDAASEWFYAGTSGCVDLISSGTAQEQSAFLDASASGDDVFLMTLAHLTAQDSDTSYDVYDAHVCSVSAPCIASVASSPPCSTGDSCKAAPSPQPTLFGAPPSATFSGAGNVTPEPRIARRSVTRAQKLARALRACHRKRPKRKRLVCQRRARRRFTAKKATRGSK